MKKYIKEIIIFIIQFGMFYFFPLTAGPTDAMGLVVILLMVTFVLSTAITIISKEKIKYLYPIVISIIFMPTIFIYYNDSALIHAVWYLIDSLLGVLLGFIVLTLMKIDKK